MNEYFQRQVILPEIGEEGQKLLSQASVLVVGAGALGCPVIQYLAAAGVGKITVMDDDQVHSSNLHRQVLYGKEDVNKSKVLALEAKLVGQFPWVNFSFLNERLAPMNARDRVKSADLVVDCSDNFPTRYLVNDTCVLLDKTFVSASILRFSGQLAVYNFKGSGTYRCLFPEAGNGDENCSTAGVIGALAGVLGSLQAMEAVKIITGAGKSLAGNLLIYDGLNNSFNRLSFTRHPDAERVAAEAFEKGRYESEVCDTDSEDVLLVDVREPWEHEERNFGGVNIPLAELPHRFQELLTGKPVRFYCDHGQRSRLAVELMREKGLDCDISEAF